MNFVFYVYEISSSCFWKRKERKYVQYVCVSVVKTFDLIYVMADIYCDTYVVIEKLS